MSPKGAGALGWTLAVDLLTLVGLALAFLLVIWLSVVQSAIVFRSVGSGVDGPSHLDKTNCPACGARVGADRETCDYCGERLPSDDPDAGSAG